MIQKLTGSSLRHLKFLKTKITIDNFLRQPLLNKPVLNSESEILKKNPAIHILGMSSFEKNAN